MAIWARTLLDIGISYGGRFKADRWGSGGRAALTNSKLSANAGSKPNDGNRGREVARGCAPALKDRADCGQRRRVAVRGGIAAACGAVAAGRREPESAASESAWRSAVAREVVDELRMPEAHLVFAGCTFITSFLIMEIKECNLHRNTLRGTMCGYACDRVEE